MYRDKDTLEKERLQNRTGGYHRHEDVGAPTRVQKDLCPSYLDERKRFIVTTDVAKIEAQEREHEWNVRNDKTEMKRAADFQRQDERWKALERKEREFQNKLDRLQDDPMMGRKNVGGVPYNLVNHRYDDSLDGQRLHYHDNMVKYRGDVRSTHLAARGHLGFNPITGEQTHPLRVPEKPMPGAALAQML